METMTIEEVTAAREKYRDDLIYAVQTACPQMENKRVVLNILNRDKPILSIGWHCYSKKNPEDRPPANLLELEEAWLDTPLPEDLPTSMEFNGKTMLLEHKKATLAYQ